MSQNGHKEFTSLADLKPDQANARKHNPRNVGMLVDSLHQVGAARSIVVDEDGVVLAGNATIEAAAEAGIHRVKTVEADGSEIVAVVRRGLSKEQKTKLALYDNRVAELAEWNPDILAELVDTKALEGMFSDKELAEILTQTGVEPKDAEPQIDKAEELRQKWGTEPGQLWVIGNHKLLCGDSGRTGSVFGLMGDSVFDVLVTSPPYSNQREYKIGDFDWLNLMNSTWDEAVKVAGEGCHILVNLGPSHKDRKVDRYWDKWLEHAESGGWPLFGWYVWDKGQALPGNWNGRLAPAHEFIFHFNNESGQANKWIKSGSKGTGAKSFRQKDGTLKPPTSPHKIGQPFKVPDSVVRVSPHKGKDAGHPAMFSEAFAAFLIQTWSQLGDLVYEPFCGSGTTLVAAENLNRKCYAIEISPAYVAVCLERMTTAFPHLKIEKIDRAEAA